MTTPPRLQRLLLQMLFWLLLWLLVCCQRGSRSGAVFASWHSGRRCGARAVREPELLLLWLPLLLLCSSGKLLHFPETSVAAAETAIEAQWVATVSLLRVTG